MSRGPRLCIAHCRLETFPGIPRLVQAVLFNTLVVILPYGALAFCSFWGLEAASKMYRIVGLASSAALLAIYGRSSSGAKPISFSRCLEAMIDGMASSALCFRYGACQRYGWVARAIVKASSLRLCWRKKGKKQEQEQEEARDAEGGDSTWHEVSDEAEGLKVSEGLPMSLRASNSHRLCVDNMNLLDLGRAGWCAHLCQGQPGMTVSGSCSLGLVQLRHSWTADSIRAALPIETDLVPHRDKDSAAENKNGLAGDFIPEARVGLLLGFLALAAIGCVVHYQASIYAAVVFLFMVGTLGCPLVNQLVKLSFQRRRASASDTPEAPGRAEEAPLQAIPSRRLQVVDCSDACGSPTGMGMP